jgi:hypothetical protein
MQRRLLREVWGMYRIICAVVAGGLLLAAGGTTTPERALNGGGIGGLGGGVIGAVAQFNPLLGGLGGAVAGAAVGLLASAKDTDTGTPGGSRGEPWLGSADGPASHSGNAGDAGSPPREPQPTGAKDPASPAAAPSTLEPTGHAVQESTSPRVEPVWTQRAAG